MINKKNTLMAGALVALETFGAANSSSSLRMRSCIGGVTTSDLDLYCRGLTGQSSPSLYEIFMREGAYEIRGESFVSPPHATTAHAYGCLVGASCAGFVANAPALSQAGRLRELHDKIIGRSAMTLIIQMLQRVVFASPVAT